MIVDSGIANASDEAVTKFYAEQLRIARYRSAAL